MADTRRTVGAKATDAKAVVDVRLADASLADAKAPADAKTGKSGKSTKSWAQGYPVGTRVRVQVGLSAGQLGEVADVYGDAHRPPVSPYKWYGVRLANGLRPLYRHDELKPVH
ncbi:MAG: hypothetical protein HOV68_15335 [Streptomycetaceae bacterium]|nr:hypothetical protein [Streptomycetaceae bacterium]